MILHEETPQITMIENFLGSLVEKLKMVSMSIMVSKDIIVMRNDKLSGHLLVVDEISSKQNMENVFIN